MQKNTAINNYNKQNPLDLIGLNQLLQNQELLYQLKSIILTLGDDKTNIMDNSKEILKKHYEQYPLKKKSDGRYYTYLPDKNHPRGRKDITRVNKDKLNEAVLQYYADISADNLKFCNVFYKWAQSRENTMVCQDTIRKDFSDFDRFFCKKSRRSHRRERDAKIKDMPIDKINANHINEFLSESQKLYNLNRKSLNNLFCLLNQVFEYAVEEEYIKDSPVRRAKIKRLRRQTPLVTNGIGNSQDNISGKELTAFINALEKYHLEHPTDLRYCAVLFQIWTGLRPGEIGGLQWSDIKRKGNIHQPNDCALICHSLKQNGNKWFLSDTKTHESRPLPLTERTNNILNMVQEINKQTNLTSDYVFFNVRNNVITPFNNRDINNFMRKISNLADIRKISSTKFRKNINGQMRGAGIGDAIRDETLGHTESVNKTNYSNHSQISVKIKSEALRKAEEMMENIMKTSTTDVDE